MGGSKQWRSKRFQVFERDGWTCKDCGHSPPPEYRVRSRMIAPGPVSKRLTVDHIIPKSRGGSDELENLQTLCGECNCRKANLRPGEVIRDVRGLLRNMNIVDEHDLDCGIWDDLPKSGVPDLSRCDCGASPDCSPL